ncbi:transcriptional regulator with XRE-family HTH domain [Arthrobacter sp. CAN_A212]|uniref:helix-turn-helix domain-containing protein n=1 Tax=unclassified Arthrobacter TaxID=235627 RepID=UPI0018C9BCAA|nr:helix-turn-helix transcriptional regulator [Arthrobacter sp. CAN_C5]MBP2218103.1 transcriptional regulator with XRE-family HTH domain [Arthrobacter sp. CAN_C5]
MTSNTTPERLTAVGRRIRELREGQRVSLSALAARAGIGKGTLSELETGQRNPTLETLYALAAPLRVPLAVLLGEELGAEASDEAVTARLLGVRHHDDGGITEVYWLAIAPNGSRVSPPHGPGVSEHLLVVRGSATAGRTGEQASIPTGGFHAWASDTEHSYGAGAEGAVAVLTITSPPPSGNPTP